MRVFNYSIGVFDKNGKEVNIDREKKVNFMKGLRNMTEIPKIHLMSGEIFSLGGKVMTEWRTWENDMKRFSRMYPDYMFGVEITKIEGIRLGDSFNSFFKNGQIVKGD